LSYYLVIKMKKVLIIEDNIEIRENIVEFLSLEGYNMSEATDGKTGLQLVKELFPDIILCDIQMPNLNGYEVLQSLKENESTKNIPFIFLTANVEKKDVAAGLEMGADGYVSKPFETHILLKEIERCLFNKD
jgi:CheY-like chemotaxis protein